MARMSNTAPLVPYAATLRRIVVPFGARRVRLDAVPPADDASPYAPIRADARALPPARPTPLLPAAAPAGGETDF